ncbi:hypothetical protein Tco_0016558 [Tanacetum coccineum]
MKRPCKGFSGRVTPLFSTMMVQATEDMGEDSAAPSDSHSTPIISQPSSSKLQNKKSRRKQRKDSAPTEPTTEETYQMRPYVLLPLPKIHLKMCVGRARKICAEKEVSAADPVTTASEVVTTANVEVTTINAPTTNINELTLAQTLIKIKAAKPKAVTSAAITTTTIRPKPEVPLKKKDQIAMDKEVARNLEAQLQAELEEEERLARKKEEEANIALLNQRITHNVLLDADFNWLNKCKQKNKKQTWCWIANTSAKSKSYDEIQEMFDKEMKRVNTFVDMNTELVKGSKTKAEADGSSKRYSSMIKMLQGIDREDLETIWKLVKAKHENTRPEDNYERVLWGDLKVMFKPDIKSEVWRNLQGYKVTV